MPVMTGHGRRVLFVHVPKTGGTYVEDLFRANDFQLSFWKPRRDKPAEMISPQHYHARLLAALFDMTAFDHVFMTVRDPLDRLISEYLMRVPDGDTPFETWAQEALDRFEKDPRHLDNHLRPQADFAMRGITVMRQEAGLGENLTRHLETTLDIPFAVRTVPRRRGPGKDSHAPRPDRDNLSADLLARVATLYGRDYALFGYDRPGSS
ncbi:sulfotransferase family 2 domain-containing protein [Yunchengibacter salinarum]|uniref:sulfotransferase family 2 domain-containing protein n=1 Tax=Yunchengibacter salinarum TaxID=3133399 RepID=UPI0035B6AB4D